MSPSPRARAILSLAWLRTDEYRVLLDAFGSADAIVDSSASRLEAAGLGPDKANRIAAPDQEALAATLEWLDQPDQTLLFIDDADYPALLADVRGAPLGLYVKGIATALALPALAIVGSRNPTRGGIGTARDFAAHLGRVGFSIVSGLAEGIDRAAHEGALEASTTTVAVMGTGTDRVYPSQHRELAHRIAGSGAIVSEYPLGTPPRRQHFPDRNRIITGLSLGTLVVEAARRSGSLISARLAAEQGREVFAIPGSIHNPMARGCHRLIREGARLVETADDIMSELGPLVGHLVDTGHDSTSTPTSSPEHEDLLLAMGYDPVGVDELLNRSGLTIEELSSMLLILELEGRIEKLSGGQYARLDEHSA